MVYRYRDALRDDEKLRRTLECLRPVRRRAVPIGLACICTVLLLLARLEGGPRSYVSVFFGCLVALLFTARFVQQHRIVRNWAAAVGTLISFQKLMNRRGGAAIKYLFRGSDGLLHLGNATGSVRLKDSETLGIIYCRDKPSRSMLLSQFWFYDFSPATSGEETEISKILGSLKADS